MSTPDYRAWVIITIALAATTHQAILGHFMATAVCALGTLGLILAWARRRHREEALRLYLEEVHP